MEGEGTTQQTKWKKKGGKTAQRKTPSERHPGTAPRQPPTRASPALTQRPAQARQHSSPTTTTNCGSPRRAAPFIPAPISRGDGRAAADRGGGGVARPRRSLPARPPCKGSMTWQIGPAPAGGSAAGCHRSRTAAVPCPGLRGAAEERELMGQFSGGRHGRAGRWFRWLSARRNHSVRALM